MKNRTSVPACQPIPLRRSLLLTALACAAPAWAAGAPAPRADSEAKAAAGLAEIESDSGGRMGLHAVDTASGRSLSHRGAERFAMASTFKLLLAAAVLHREDQAPGAVLDQRLSLHQADLIAYSPVASQHLQAGFITVREACAAAVELSDNGAANLLLKQVGGPAGLTGFLRKRCGDGITRLDRTEPTLNTNLPGDLRDTTTPQAMAHTTARLVEGNVLSGASRAQLRSWLEACSTGQARLRAGLPGDWRVGDKTGTGANGAANDVAVGWPPGRAPIVLAVYLSGSSRPPAVLDTTHARAAAVVAAFFAGAKA